MFIEEILKYKSLSIVGTEKNTGKTETLNYVLGRLKHYNKNIAITSIGIDGETVDQVTQTKKPEIVVYENMLFVTAEQHFLQKKIPAEILHVGQRFTSLGRLVTARAKNSGKILLSGPADTITLQQTIANNLKLDTDITIVDGALSRLSLASPTITEAMILATGAALSLNIKQLIQKTKFICDLIALDVVEECIYNKLKNINTGLWIYNDKEIFIQLKIESSLMLSKAESEDKFYLSKTNMLYVSGVVTDSLLNFLRLQKNMKDFVLIVKDFTKIFVSTEAYLAFCRKGATIKVLHKTKLLALTINPTSPKGYALNSEILQKSLSDATNLPVFDVKNMKN